MSTITVAAGDAASLRTAIETTAVVGDVVQVPRATYSLVAAITVNKGIRIVGEGGEGTIIASSGAVHGLVIDPTAAAGNLIDRLFISDLSFSGDGVNNLTGIRTNNVAGKTIKDLNIERCTVSGFTNGISIGGGTMTTLYPRLEKCRVTNNLEQGMTVVFASAGLRIEQCVAVANNLNNNASASANAQVLISKCNNFIVDGLDANTMPTAVGATKCGLAVAQCIGGNIRALTVSQAAFQSDSIGLHLMTPSCKGISMDGLGYSFITSPIVTDAGCEAPWIRNAGIFRLAP